MYIYIYIHIANSSSGLKSAGVLNQLCLCHEPSNGRGRRCLEPVGRRTTLTKDHLG